MNVKKISKKIEWDEEIYIMIVDLEYFIRVCTLLKMTLGKHVFVFERLTKAS